MNTYDIDNIKDAQEQFQVTITKEMMEMFGSITGDRNPLHMDSDYARAKGYSDRVVYGLLTGSLLSTLCGMYLPGERSLIQEMDVKFPKPVFVGDTLIVAGRVVEVHKGLRQIVLKVDIKNQNHEKVLRGKMRVGLTDG